MFGFEEDEITRFKNIRNELSDHINSLEVEKFDALHGTIDFLAGIIHNVAEPGKEESVLNYSIDLLRFLANDYIQQPNENNNFEDV